MRSFVSPVLRARDRASTSCTWYPLLWMLGLRRAKAKRLTILGRFGEMDDIWFLGACNCRTRGAKWVSTASRIHSSIDQQNCVSSSMETEVRPCSSLVLAAFLFHSSRVLFAPMPHSTHIRAELPP